MFKTLRELDESGGCLGALILLLAWFAMVGAVAGCIYIVRGFQ